MDELKVECEIYAMYAVYCHNLDLISKTVDFRSPARVVALVSSPAAADCIIQEYNKNYPGIAFSKELDHTQRIEVDYTPLPFI